jgi:hypothetical protein
MPSLDALSRYWRWTVRGCDSSVLSLCWIMIKLWFGALASWALVESRYLILCDLSIIYMFQGIQELIQPCWARVNRRRCHTKDKYSHNEWRVSRTPRVSSAEEARPLRCWSTKGGKLRRPLERHEARYRRSSIVKLHHTTISEVQRMDHHTRAGQGKSCEKGAYERSKPRPAASQ